MFTVIYLATFNTLIVTATLGAWIIESPPVFSWDTLIVLAVLYFFGYGGYAATKKALEERRWTKAGDAYILARHLGHGDEEAYQRGLRAMCTAHEAMKHAISCELQALKYLKELPEPQGPKLHMYYMEMADQWWLVNELKGGTGKKAGGASSS